MRVLIVYATRGGLSRQCAELLREQLIRCCEVNCFSIEEDLPDPASYDVAVLGGSIRMGKLNAKLKNYVKVNRNTLEGMESAFFMCCGLPDEFEDYVDSQLPKNMRFSLGVHNFGGELKPQKRKGLDKLAVYLMRSHIRTKDFEDGEYHDYVLPEMIPEHVIQLAERIRRL